MKIILGTPSASSNAVLPHEGSLLELQNECFDRGIRFGRPAFGMAAQLNGIRDAILYEFLDRTDGDLLFFVDADQSFEPEDFFNLLKPIELGLVDVCAASIGLKHHDVQRIRAAALLGQSDIMRAGVTGLSFLPTGGGFRLARQFYLYAKVGMGMTLITRRAVEIAVSRATTFYETKMDNGDPGPKKGVVFEDTAEDLAFCQKVLDGGGKIAAHINSQALHWGLVAFQNNAPAILQERGIKLEFPDSTPR